MDFINTLQTFFINSILPFFALIAVIFFVWGVVTLTTADENDQWEEGRNLVIYGFIGVVIIGVLWSILRFFIIIQKIDFFP